MRENNKFNLSLLLLLGTGFILCVVSVTNPIFTLDMQTVYTVFPATPSPFTFPPTAAPPTTPAPPNSTAPPANETNATIFTNGSFPEITLKIVCPMFKNCSRSGGGVAPDNYVGDLNEISEIMGCGTARIVRGFCLLTLSSAALATIFAAAAMQDMGCATRPVVRRVILGASILNFVASVAAVTLIALMMKCLGTTLSSGHSLIWFIPNFRDVPLLSKVDSIAFPLYLSAMACSVSGIVLSVLWLRGVLGPEEVIPPPEVESPGKVDAVAAVPVPVAKSYDPEKEAAARKLAALLVQQPSIGLLDLEPTDMAEMPLLTQNELADVLGGSK